MEPLFNLEVQGRRSSRYPCGNISITLKQRFQKRYRLPSNGREIILEDISTSPYHFPTIQFPPNALTSPMFVYQTLMMVLNLGQELCMFLHEHISDMALFLSDGGLRGFHLIADVEVVRTEVVENIEVAGGGGDGGIGRRRMIRKEMLRIVVEKLSMKPKRDVKPGETCAVCLDELEERVEAEGNKRGVAAAVVMAMPCDHLFHQSCISKWFQKKVSCPLCRRVIKRADLVG